MISWIWRQKAQITKANRQMGLYQAKKALHSKGDNERQPTEWEKMFSGVLKSHKTNHRHANVRFSLALMTGKSVTYLHVFQIWNRKQLLRHTGVLPSVGDNIQVLSEFVLCQNLRGVASSLK